MPTCTVWAATSGYFWHNGHGSEPHFPTQPQNSHSELHSSDSWETLGNCFLSWQRKKGVCFDWFPEDVASFTMTSFLLLCL